MKKITKRNIDELIEDINESLKNKKLKLYDLIEDEKKPDNPYRFGYFTYNDKKATLNLYTFNDKLPIFV